jgi:putative CocE/NonD family hydrolase
MAKENPLEILGVADVAHLEEGLLVPLRDGTKLIATAVVANGGAKGPVILVQSPYPNQAEFHGGRDLFQRLIRKGYSIVVVNDRGTQWSEGEYRWQVQSSNDGTDVVKWVNSQPWSDGSVGGWGCSSSGEVNLGLARANPPGLKAIIAAGAATGVGVIPGFADQGVFYTGGVPIFAWSWWYHGDGFRHHPKLPPNLSREERVALIHAFNPVAFEGISQDLSWADHLPTQDLLNAIGSPQTAFNDFIKMKPNDPAWSEQDFLRTGDKTQVPVLHVDSWYDSIEVYGTTKMFEYLTSNSPNQYMLIGGGPHCSMGRVEKQQTTVGERTIGDARFDYVGIYEKWFDHWLRNNGTGDLGMPRVQYYPLESNKWVSSDTWPPQGTVKKLFLSSAGHANGLAGDGKLVDAPAQGGADTFDSDPMKPVPSHGGGCCSSSPALDQTEVEKRKDVLVYSTERLSEPLDLAGAIKATLYLSTSVPDTDIALKVIDVYPDGKAFNVLDTIQRLRYRDGIDKESLLKPGQTYKVELGQMAIGTRIGAGHRLRIEIAGSNFPLYERNLNTGGKNYDETTGNIAHNTIFHDGERPSMLELPVTNVSAAGAK